mmetsp:Transcript_4745/g.11775  ORF Transcript_4745/g.11775 Transcript_4745/m.11775 type:complete len:372 (+) Transcript_4745:1589-2704(+)
MQICFDVDVDGVDEGFMAGDFCQHLYPQHVGLALDRVHEILGRRQAIHHRRQHLLILNEHEGILVVVHRAFHKRGKGLAERELFLHGLSAARHREGPGVDAVEVAELLEDGAEPMSHVGAVKLAQADDDTGSPVVLIPLVVDHVVQRRQYHLLHHFEDLCQSVAPGLAQVCECGEAQFAHAVVRAGAESSQGPHQQQAGLWVTFRDRGDLLDEERHGLAFAGLDLDAVEHLLERPMLTTACAPATLGTGHEDGRVRGLEDDADGLLYAGGVGVGEHLVEFVDEVRDLGHGLPVVVPARLRFRQAVAVHGGVLWLLRASAGVARVACASIGFCSLRQPRIRFPVLAVYPSPALLHDLSQHVDPVLDEVLLSL